MEKVKDFYNKVLEKEGKEIADKFLRLMENWDDSRGVIHAFYEENLLESMLNEIKSKTKMKKKSEVNALAFSSTARKEKPDILEGKTPEEFLKEKYNEGITFGIENLQHEGIYRLWGWAFDFTPFMNQYLVKQYDMWQEYWAPNKTMLRTSLYGEIDKIVALKSI